MKKNRSIVSAFVKTAVCAFALSTIACASKQISSDSQNAIDQDGNGVAQGTSTEADLSPVKPKEEKEQRISPLIRVPHGSNKSP